MELESQIYKLTSEKTAAEASLSQMQNELVDQKEREEELTNTLD